MSRNPFDAPDRSRRWASLLIKGFYCMKTSKSKKQETQVFYGLCLDSIMLYYLIPGCCLEWKVHNNGMGYLLVDLDVYMTVCISSHKAYLSKTQKPVRSTKEKKCWYLCIYSASKCNSTWNDNKCKQSKKCKDLQTQRTLVSSTVSLEFLF